MGKVAGMGGLGRLAPGMLTKLEAAMADAWAAVDAAWKRIGAIEQAAQARQTQALAAPRALDGFRVGGGGGDPSALGLP